TETPLQSKTLAGYGDYHQTKHELLAVAYTRVIAHVVTHELRTGLNRVRIDFIQDFNTAAADYGIASPSSVPPNFNVSSGTLRFGGIDGFPQGRGDTTFQYSDTLSWIAGRQSCKLGAEFRR